MNSTLNSTIWADNSTVTDVPAPAGGGAPPPFVPGAYTDAKEWIWKLVPPIVVILGTFGNVLTIVVLLRQFKNLSSTAVYLMTLAFSDLMILYLGPIRQWIQYIWDIDVRLLTDAGCRTSLFFTYFSFQLSSWLLVAVTIERVISVMLPHKVKLGCTTMKAGITVLITIVCLAALNAHYFYGYKMTHNPSNPRAPIVCGPYYDDYKEFVYDIWPWVDFAISFAVPFIIMTVGNTLIIVSLKRQTQRRRKMGISQTEKEGRSITVMLILLCVIYFICLTPYTIFFIVLPYARKEAFKLPYSEMLKRMEMLIFVHAVVSCFSYINSATNFLLYFLSGSRFRAEVRHLFTCRRAGKDGVFGSSTAGRSTSFTNTRSSSANGGPKHSSITSAGKAVYDASSIDPISPYEYKAFEKNEETLGEDEREENFTDIKRVDDEYSVNVDNVVETEMLSNHL